MTPLPPEPPAFDLLNIALRSRASTVDELAKLSLLAPDEVRRLLDGLESLGYLTRDGDHVDYLQASTAAGSDIHRQAERIAGNLGRDLDSLLTVVDQLPRLIQSWAIGSSGTDLGESSMDGKVFHHEWAVTDLWFELLEREPMLRSDVVLPDTSRMYTPDPTQQPLWHEKLQRPGSSFRVILAPGDAYAPGAQERLAEEIAAGAEFRMLAQPPSWFWVADGEILALPLRWGEAWPTSVVALRNQAAAGMGHWVFEHLWKRALPLLVEAPAWEPLLRLVSAGASVEAAARKLGISDRTGRRRMNDAMDHFGVNNLMALGAAWGATQP